MYLFLISGGKDTFFAIASGMLPPDAPMDATADLVSAYFDVKEHPYECFGFWVHFSVRCVFFSKFHYNRKRSIIRLGLFKTQAILNRTGLFSKHTYLKL